MPFCRLIPCLDVDAGRVVKGVRFRDLRDMGDPVELAARYSAQGADELVFLDVTATLEARRALLDVVGDIADRIGIPLTVGGALRTLDDAQAFLLAGADKVAINTAAVEHPALITQLAERYGAQAVVVAIDAAGGQVRTHAGTRATGMSAPDWARTAVACGAGELLLTSIDADGTQNGYDLALTESVAAAVDVPVIASGGAGTPAHVAAALEVTQAALVASLVHTREDGVRWLRDELRAQGVTLRDV
ncbi:MAG: imidazole glycerol phosphate synthase subunit HisF [Candidatus Dormibacteraeota bacterium]|nr:imidazole glycerol phosphate synthase subunit HisF [Candidatus Dormibacteraeota bacterium]MBV9524831.1 imidazole glycerol phosphate synthase subunit HisF [Candidatus Dormibacteraeota bacterium]